MRCGGEPYRPPASATMRGDETVDVVALRPRHRVRGHARAASRWSPGRCSTSRVPGPSACRGRGEEEAHSRGRREGDVVGAADGGELGSRPVGRQRSRTEPSRRPRPRARAARQGARRAPRQRGQRARGTPARRQAPRPGLRRRSARARRRRSARARAGPPPSPGRSPPRALDGTRARRARRRADARTAPALRWDWSGRPGHSVRSRGPGRATRRSGSPASRWPRRRARAAGSPAPLACARARVTAMVRPASGRASNQRKLIAQRRHGTEQRDRGRADPGLHGDVGDRGQRARHHPLPAEGSAFDHGGGLVGGAAAAMQPLSDLRQLADAHVDHQRARERGQRRPVQRRYRACQGPRDR